MKRFVVPSVLLFAALVLPGCPIYGDDTACSRNSDCPSDYLCESLTGLCRSSVALGCNDPGECSRGETCGRDGRCHAGDCSWRSIGCIAGYRCSSETGRFECIRPGSAGAGGQEGSAGGQEGSAGGQGGSAGSSAGAGGGA